ncbi:MAG: hypothetical protein WBQ79_02255 [Acidobacteriaceae bacterium]
MHRAHSTEPAAPALVNLSMRATPLELIREIGLQTRVPIGIIPGQDANALCGSKSTVVFLGDPPQDSLEAIAQQVHFTLNQEDGVFVLTAPDVTPHQRDVLDHRFRMYRTGRKSIVQMISVQLSEKLWTAYAKPAAAGLAGSIPSSANAPKISLPPVLHNVTAQDIAALVVKSAPGGIYLSRISPARMDSSNDLKIQFESYGDPDQLKLDMSCR